jgi:hypothetical protein
MPVSGTPTLLERLLTKPVERGDMGAGGKFGHHAAKGGMQIELAEHHVGEDLAADPSVEAAHHSGRGSSQLVSIPRMSRLAFHGHVSLRSSFQVEPVSVMPACARGVQSHDGP